MKSLRKSLTALTAIVTVLVPLSGIARVNAQTKATAQNRSLRQMPVAQKMPVLQKTPALLTRHLEKPRRHDVRPNGAPTTTTLPNYGPNGLGPAGGGQFTPRTFSVYSRAEVDDEWQFEGTFRTYSEAMQSASDLHYNLGCLVFIR
jgi:hypothetical protein